MTLLIDADWLIYSSCCACEQDIKWDDNLHTLHADERDVHEMIDGRIAHYQALAEDKEDVVMCFTQYPTFRHTIYPEYKANRKHKRKPLGLGKIIEQTKERYQFESYEGLEGDDVMAILATSKKYPDPIIVSVDKDMRSVPCTLLAGDDLELITRRKANRHWMIQALTGDSTDNYFGIDKVGPVTAEKILGDAKTLEEMWEKVVEAYEKKKYNFADAVLNAQLARILRDGDFDFQTGEVSLWTP
tara:strand:- start:5260 stop:5991 length:732 start_codon:yes stop_codon:yes gene_type:complete